MNMRIYMYLSALLTSSLILHNMETDSANEFGLVIPTLAPGVSHCEGMAPATWNTKAVTLTNEARVDVAEGICHSVDANLLTHIDG